jgi:molybdopterin molybdotransferase
VRPFQHTIPLEEALARLEASARPIDRVERVPLEAAAGRVLAAAVRADRDVPPFDRAAMDGYAVRAADTAGATPEQPAVLVCRGVAFTGEPADLRVDPGTAVTIATGAPVPPGADAVVMVEQTSLEAGGGRVRIHTEAEPGQHIGRRGSDIAAGHLVVDAGELLNPARVGALAALGRTEVEVYGRPRVFLASTGNEIVEPGQPLAPGRIYDINRYTLAAVVSAHGGEPIAGARAADSIASLHEVLDRAGAAGADLVVLSGGSSVGDRDLVADVAASRGEVIFHGIAVKPGKPTLLARLGTRLLLGMPGNPTSCLSNAYLLLVPLLRRLARLPPWRPERRTLPLARPIVSRAGRHTFYTVRVEREQVVPAFKGSGDITSLAWADGYIEIPATTERIEAGTPVTVTFF